MSTSAGAPAERAWILSDEPLPVRLMATIRAGADGIRDDLSTTADVDEWLDAVGIDRAGAHATERELAQARSLRDTRPAAASAMTDVATALDLVNSVVAELPAPRLALRDGRLALGADRGTS